VQARGNWVIFHCSANANLPEWLSGAETAPPLLGLSPPSSRSFLLLKIACEVSRVAPAVFRRLDRVPGTHPRRSLCNCSIIDFESVKKLAARTRAYTLILQVSFHLGSRKKSHRRLRGENYLCAGPEKSFQRIHLERVNALFESATAALPIYFEGPPRFIPIW